MANVEVRHKFALAAIYCPKSGWSHKFGIEYRPTFDLKEQAWDYGVIYTEKEHGLLGLTQPSEIHFTVVDVYVRTTL